MWFFPTKKEIKKELKKIAETFQYQREELEINREQIEKLKEKVESNSLKIATLEGSYLVLSQKSQVSVSSKSQESLKKSQAVSGQGLETKLIQRIKQNKKSLIMAEIMKLLPSYSVIEAFDIIVKQRNLCSKASFYRYIESLKSQKLVSNEAKVRLN